VADEAERVGGISVEASISQAGVDAQLEALLGKMQAAAAKMSAALTIQPHVATPTQARTTQTAQAQAVVPQPPPRRQPPPQSYAQMAYERMAPAGGAGASAYDSLEKAIREQLGEQAEGLGHLGETVQQAARSQQAEFVQDVHASPAAEPLVLAVSTSEAKEQLNVFLGEFKTEMAAAQKAAIIHIEVERPPVAATRPVAPAPAAPVAPVRSRRAAIRAAAAEEATEEANVTRQRSTRQRAAARADQAALTQTTRTPIEPIVIPVSTEQAKRDTEEFYAQFKGSLAGLENVPIKVVVDPAAAATAERELERLRVNAARPAPLAKNVTQAAAGGDGGRRGGSRARASAPPPGDDEQPRATTPAARSAPRRKNIDRTAIAAEMGEEEQGRLGFQTRMAANELREGDRHQARVQQSRRTAAQRAFSESERARRVELTTQGRHYDNLAALATSYFDDQAARADRAAGISAKADEQRRLTELSYEAQHEEGNQPQSTGFAGRQRSPQEIEAFRRSEAQRAALLSGAAQQPVNLAAEAEARRARTRRLADQREERRQSLQISRDEATAQTRGPATTARGRGPAVRRTEEDVARREAERIASSEAQTFTAGRTLRTFESSLGGFLAGGRQRVEAQAALAAANEKVRISQDRLREPDVLKSRTATRQATEELTAAENERAKALERVQSFSGPSAAIRTFVGIGVATVGFSLALKGVDVALSAIGPALGDFIDMQGGFAAKSTAVTSALAQQTVAQKGNVDAVLAQQAATAGLSATTSDYLSTQLKLTTQVKAGAIAQQQASDLFRASTGTNQQAPQGLFGGFGGVAGTSFLAQQLGGGKGVSELIAGDLGGLSKTQGKGPFDDIGKALDFLSQPAFRDFVTRQEQPIRQGNDRGPLGTATDIAGGVGDAIRGLGPLGGLAGIGLGVAFPKTPAPPENQIGPPTPPESAFQSSLKPGQRNAIDAYVKNLEDASKRGGEALGRTATVTYAYARSTDELAAAEQRAVQAGDTYGVQLAETTGLILKVNGAVAQTAEEYKKALEQISVGASIPDTATLSRLAQANERQREREAAASVPALQQQFAYERPAFLASTQRQQQFQQFTQLPAQQSLQNLAQPLLPTNTGIVAANRKEQERINTDLKGANQLQDQLNANYAAGLKVLEETYKPELIKNFGSAAGVAFQSALNGVVATGKQIAGLQTSIVNEQAAYQVAQYNYQLFIARRSLADIGGLTGKNFGAGQSYLGVLERQNLVLSRQGQLLQFNLQQRQINFQTALAGFQAPGVTPEERQANIKEAQIEADYAQKQLDIQRQMFGNQVQIVDIQNLRQGADLARQIGLLLQGRQVTIDVKVKTAELERAQQLQQQQVAAVGTYLSQVDAVINHDFAQMTALETAAGKAMFGASKYAADAFNTYLSRTITYLNSYAASFAGAQTSGGYHDQGNKVGGAAGGALFNTGGGPVGMMTVGENDRNETVAVLRNPHTAAMLGGGGGDTTVNFGDVYVRNDSDIDAIARAVTKVIGREGALKGMRGVN